MPLLLYALAAALSFSLAARHFVRRHRRQQLNDLLYVAAAMAWISACSDGKSHHAV